MGISLLQYGVHRFKRISDSVSSLQKRGGKPKTNPEVVVLARGIALLLIALALGWISLTSTENATREKVLQTEWPPQAVFSAILNQGGWRRLEHPDFSRLLKNHPAPFSDESKIWESADHCEIYLSGPKSEFWSCAHSREAPYPKVSWRLIGAGYAGLNRLSQLVIPSAKKAVSYVDPKEIRY